MVSVVADYILEIVVPSIEAYQIVLKERLLTLSMIKDVQSNIVLETVKENAPIPVDRYDSA
jgi:Lrp/AsnC family leucine-responsive transcriptional regulator